MSDQPKPAGEWTARTVIDMIAKDSNAEWNVADAHNAALSDAKSERCEVCNTELSQCGVQGVDGEPSLDCLVCKLREQLTAEREKWKHYQDVARANGCDSVTDAFVQLKQLRDKLLQLESFGEQLADQQIANQQLRAAAERRNTKQLMDALKDIRVGAPDIVKQQIKDVLAKVEK